MANSKTKRIISITAWDGVARPWEFTQTGKACGYGREIGEKGNPVGVTWRIFQSIKDGSVDTWKTNGRITWQELKQY